MKRIVFVLLILSICNVGYSEPIRTVLETKTLSDKVMQYFLKAEFTKGLSLAKKHWPLPPVEIDNLANTIETQWVVVKQRFGKPTGIEYIKSEKLGDSFIRYYYLHKFENHAIYWRFTYYKPKAEWKVNGITFKDSLDFLFVPN